ncbi:MAG TPA: STAS domain-containing protein [Acidimicrobiia bacterium]|jgi:rsbT antagonist protein RsbS|nr:STAS domain-containing protein [Acidimicrobiia bacterium]
MAGDSDTARIPLQVSQGCIVASVQVDLRPDVLAGLQTDVLNLLRDSGARAVIIDLSGVQTIDPEEFEALRRTSDMARLMGARSVMSGLNAGVVSSLVDLDVTTSDVEATRTLDAAFALVRSESDSLRQAPWIGYPTEELDAADGLGPE